jgi:hypothetical protein
VVFAWRTPRLTPRAQFFVARFFSLRWKGRGRLRWGGHLLFRKHRRQTSKLSRHVRVKYLRGESLTTNLRQASAKVGLEAGTSSIQKMHLGGSIMNTWRKKFFAFLLALIAISVLGGPLAATSSAAPVPAAQHGKRHHHRRHHRRPRHHR